MDSDEDDFVSVGTPLEPLDDNEIPSKKPFRDEGVRDEKGRYRFHGAFTGGFSAGFFNSVGSVEGWEPSSFVSTRGKKSENIQQKPEDFMDAEDFGQFGIAPRKIKVAAEFERSSDKSRKRGPYFKEGPIPGEPPLKDIVRPIGQSIGLKILQKMGWRPGQGIGPRIKMKHKKNSAKSYGCAPPPNNSDSEDDDPLAAGFTFAPDDIATLPYTPKDNLHGIGYSGLSRSRVLSAPLNIFNPTSTRAMMEKGKKKLAITGQAFGVGALEDEDEDIYAKDDMSQYDFSADEPSSHDVKSSNRNQFSFESTRHLAKVLEGFHLATKPPLKKKDYPPPPLPPNFKPIHILINFHSEKQPTENRFLDRHKMSGLERNLILEPKQISEKTSVFDMLSPESRAHLEEAKKNIDKPTSSSPNSSQILQTVSQSTEPNLKPFVNDEAKQKRYEQYLVLLKEGKKEFLEQLQPSSMTEWEKRREQGEFDRAAVLFKPRSSTLNTRFVSSAFLENDNSAEVRINKEVNESEKAKAADMKMFGQLTREKFEWHPSALLCRRFNVPAPYADSFVGLPKVKRDKFSIFNFLSTPTESDLKHECIAQKANITDQNEEPSQDSISIEKNTSKERDIPSEDKTERPPMDLFKAIFQDSTSDSSDSEEKESDVIDKPDSSSINKNTLHAENKNSAIILPSVSVSENIIRKPATGVFANIDLDALNKRPPKTNITSSTENIQLKTSTQEQKNEDKNLKNSADETVGTSTEFYGPTLPPGFNPDTPAYKTDNKDSLKQNRSKREKHRHKHKKHKSKKSKHKSKMSHKHTKRKSSKQANGSGEENTDSSDSEVCDTDILQKIKELQKLKKM